MWRLHQIDWRRVIPVVLVPLLVAAVVAAVALSGSDEPLSADARSNNDRTESGRAGAPGQQDDARGRRFGLVTPETTTTTAPSTTTTTAPPTTTTTAPSTTTTTAPSTTTTTAPSTTTTTAPPTTTTTAPPTTTTTTLPPAPPSAEGILWRAGHESGGFGEWDGVWNSGTHDASVDCGRAHTGSCSAAATIGSSGGVRLTYQGRNLAGSTDPRNLPDDAYYSAWYFIPTFAQNSWWNIFQWKKGYETSDGSRTAREMYWIVLNDSSGELRLGLHSRVTPQGEWVSGQTNALVNSNVAVPIGQWFHLESRYVWGQNGHGRITTWLDGRQVWDFSGITTDFGWSFKVWNREWTSNSYGSGMNPAPFTIWIDDAAVSTSRVGP